MRIEAQPRQPVRRQSTILRADSSRVICRLHIPGDETRTQILIKRVLQLTEENVNSLLDAVLQDFSNRHRNFRDTLKKNFDHIAGHIPKNHSLSSEQQLLLGAYFTQEYSVESAGLFNPSIVLHPDQKGVSKGSQRFIMSFRATGEGHVSSIEFRSGIVDRNSDIYLDSTSRYVATPKRHKDPVYHRHHFRRRLEAMEVSDRITNLLLEGLGANFTFAELQIQIKYLRSTKFRVKDKNQAIDIVLWLARSNYEVIFSPDEQISERVIFPVTDNESRGIEDARFVRFVDEDGGVTFYATYTAYNGFTILPQILETADFLAFKVHTLGGKAVHNKGMALFPRKINGKYAMLSRQDGVNNYIMFSDNLRFWNQAELLQEPVHPLEYVQVGNCGSPVETPEGWLALFHGVGPMRTYTLWIELLDLHDPSKVIGRLNEPLLTPDEHEREGYVPNVIYTCGCMIHGDTLIIPYGVADQRCKVATVSVPELISRLKAR